MIALSYKYFFIEKIIYNRNTFNNSSPKDGEEDVEM